MSEETKSSVMADLSSIDRVGVFGGTFNPFHRGHLACIESARARLNLDRIFVVPTARNPLKAPVEGPTDEQRIEMAKLGIESLEYASIDDQEIRRGGPSYAIETISAYAKVVAPENLHLIVGADQFESFDKWKDYGRILELANLAVIARPRHEAPFSADDMPLGLRPLVAEFDRSFAQLTSGRHIEFLRVPTLDVSATDVRKRLRTSRGVDRSLTIPVEDYIRGNGLYGPLGPKIGDFEEFTRFCAGALFDRKAIAVRGFDLRGGEAAADFTLVASGTSTRHASSLADNVMRAVKDEFNVLPQSVEGLGEGRWALLDYGALIVHVFYDFVRQEYRIEDLWRSGRDMRLVDPGAAERAAPKP